MENVLLTIFIGIAFVCIFQVSWLFTYYFINFLNLKNKKKIIKLLFKNFKVFKMFITSEKFFNFRVKNDIDIHFLYRISEFKIDGVITDVSSKFVLDTKDLYDFKEDQINYLGIITKVDFYNLNGEFETKFILNYDSKLKEITSKHLTLDFRFQVCAISKKQLNELFNN